MLPKYLALGNLVRPHMIAINSKLHKANQMEPVKMPKIVVNCIYFIWIGELETYNSLQLMKLHSCGKGFYSILWRLIRNNLYS